MLDAAGRHERGGQQFHPIRAERHHAIEDEAVGIGRHQHERMHQKEMPFFALLFGERLDLREAIRMLAPSQRGLNLFK